MTRRRLLILLLVFCPIFPTGADAALADIEKLMADGHYQQALAQLDSLLASDRQNPQYQFSRALALTASGQTAEAIAQYRSLIKAHPDLPEPYNNLAVIYFQQGKAEEARKVLEQAIQAHEGYARVFQNLQALNAARARDAYARALQMPANQQAMHLTQAEKLVLQPTRPAVKPAPASPPLTTAAKSPLRYQAEIQHADKKSEGQTNPSGAVAEDFASASQVLKRWAQAWTNKDASQYLQFYSRDYSPPGMSRTTWEQQRRQRISKPKWIRVTLRDLRLQASRGDELVVQLVQEYAADNYRDVTRKEFIMQRISGEWRIIKERGLGYMVQ